MSLTPKDPKEAWERRREWRRRSVEKYEERVRDEADSKYRDLGVNSDRKRKRRERDFGSKRDWLVTLPCTICGRTPSEPHHYPTRGAGGTKKDLTPLCARHHREFHQTGAETFQATHGVDLTEEARRYHEQWLLRRTP